MDIYNPEMKSLIAQTEEDWGDPKKNRDSLVPYGIKPFDKMLYGIDVHNGELIVVMGQEKQRKTTFAINVVINIMQADKPKDKPAIVVDSLESGMHPARYRDQMISNVASRIMLARGHRSTGGCPICNTPQCQQLVLSPEYLRYNNRTPEQAEAISEAMKEMSTWPLYVFGASPYQGGTRSLSPSVRAPDGSARDSWHYLWAKEHGLPPEVTNKVSRMSRWEWLFEEKGAKLFITDHVQQYSFTGEPNDYEKQLRAVGAVGDFVSMYKIAVMMLSQVSLTSIREASKGGKMRGLGGGKLSQEANVIFGSHYQSGDGYQKIEIIDSRKSPTFGVTQSLDESSGAYFGEATYYSGV
jgi:hypothetical protein